MKYFVVYSNDPRSDDVRGWVESIKEEETPESFVHFVDDPKLADAIIVAGGDGTIIRAIQKYKHLNKPFFGINRGTLGFLLSPMADFKAFREALLDPISSLHWQIVKLHFLQVEVEDMRGRKTSCLAFNDVYAKARDFSKSGSIIRGKIRGERYPEKRFGGDGIIVASPQGSTAYNLAAGGKISPLVSDIMTIATICSSIGTTHIADPVRAQKLVIEIDKGDAYARVDFRVIKNVRRIEVEVSKKFVELCFTPGFDFEIMRYDHERFFAR